MSTGRCLSDHHEAYSAQHSLRAPMVKIDLARRLRMRKGGILLSSDFSSRHSQVCSDDQHLYRVQTQWRIQNSSFRAHQFTLVLHCKVYCSEIPIPFDTRALTFRIRFLMVRRYNSVSSRLNFSFSLGNWLIFRSSKVSKRQGDCNNSGVKRG